MPQKKIKCIMIYGAPYSLDTSLKFLIDGEIIATGGEFTTEETVVFNTEGNVMVETGEDPITNNINKEEWYSINNPELLNSNSSEDAIIKFKNLLPFL